MRKVTSHPFEQSWIVAAFQGNNEVSMWDLETGARQQTLWASSYPPLSQSKVYGIAYFMLLTSVAQSWLTSKTSFCVLV